MAGISAAVAVPVVSSVSKSQDDNSSGRSDSVLEQTSSVGSTFSVEKCSSSLLSGDNSSISFGSGGVTQVCGNGDNSTQVQSEQEQVTQVLKNTGENPSSWSNLGIPGVKGYCESSSTLAEEGGAEHDNFSKEEQDGITLGTSDSQGCSGKEYLKLGSNSNAFLKKKKEGGEQGKIGFCDRDCGTGSRDFSVTSPTQSLRENSDKGKELSFKKLLNS